MRRRLYTPDLSNAKKNQKPLITLVNAKPLADVIEHWPFCMIKDQSMQKIIVSSWGIARMISGWV